MQREGAENAEWLFQSEQSQRLATVTQSILTYRPLSRNFGTALQSR